MEVLILMTSVSKELVPAGAGSLADLMKMIGQGQAEQQTSRWPFLKINRDADDDEGNSLPVGTFTMYSKQAGKRVYGKPALLRPLLNRYQYRLFDPDKEQYINNSIIFTDFGEDIPDEQGGFKCGKVSAKNLDTLTTLQAQAQKNIKCFRLVYGLVSLNGVTPEGEKITVDNEPVVWKVRGSNFMPIGEVFESLRKQKKLLFNYQISLDLERQKKGSNVYYVAKPTLANDDPIPLLSVDMDLLKEFITDIENQNAEIWEKHKRVQSKQPTASEKKALKVIEGESEEVSLTTLEHDMNDSIDDVGA
jgi:hypothetical protein